MQVNNYRLAASHLQVRAQCDQQPIYARTTYAIWTSPSIVGSESPYFMVYARRLTNAATPYFQPKVQTVAAVKKIVEQALSATEVARELRIRSTSPHKWKRLFTSMGRFNRKSKPPLPSTLSSSASEKRTVRIKATYAEQTPIQQKPCAQRIESHMPDIRACLPGSLTRKRFGWRSP